jgi:type VI secretion system secreted protein Hcp
MAIMLKFGDITGESKITGFDDGYLEMGSFQVGFGRGIASATGTSTREGTVTSISEIVVTKTTDKTSIDWMTQVCEGKLDNKVTICFTRTGAGQADTYLKYELEGCGVSGFSQSSGGDRPQESISLNFDKITMTYGVLGDDLTGDQLPYGWNLALGAKV